MYFNVEFINKAVLKWVSYWNIKDWMQREEFDILGFIWVIAWGIKAMRPIKFFKTKRGKICFACENLYENFHKLTLMKECYASDSEIHTCEER